MYHGPGRVDDVAQTTRHGHALLAAVALHLAVGLFGWNEAFPGESANLIPNGGFEEGTKGWYWEQWRGKKEPGYLDRKNAYKGQCCYRMVVPGQFGERRINTGASPIKPGYDYEFSLALSCTGVPKNTATIRILQWGTEKTREVKPQGWVTTRPGNGKAELIKTGGTHDWKEFKVRIPAASIKASTKKLSVYINRREVGLGLLGIDEVALYRGAWVGVQQLPE